MAGSVDGKQFRRWNGAGRQEGERLGLHRSRRWSFRPMLFAQVASQDHLRGLVLDVDDGDEVHRRGGPATHRRNRHHWGAHGFLDPTQRVGWRLDPEPPSDRGAVVSATLRTGNHSRQFLSTQTVSETGTCSNRAAGSSPVTNHCWLQTYGAIQDAPEPRHWRLFREPVLGIQPSVLVQPAVAAKSDRPWRRRQRAASNVVTCSIEPWGRRKGTDTILRRRTMVTLAGCPRQALMRGSYEEFRCRNVRIGVDDGFPCEICTRVSRGCLDESWPLAAAPEISR